MCEQYRGCEICGERRHSDQLCSVFMFIPGTPRAGQEDWSLGDACNTCGTAMRICEQCIQEEGNGIRSYVHGDFYFTSAKPIERKLERKLEGARSLMERLQWYKSSTCATCNKCIDPEATIVACVKCGGSMHKSDCVVMSHDQSCESDTTYSKCVAITRGVCGPCAAFSDDGENSIDPILAPEQHATDEPSKKRKLDA